MISTSVIGRDTRVMHTLVADTRMNVLHRGSSLTFIDSAKHSSARCMSRKSHKQTQSHPQAFPLLRRVWGCAILCMREVRNLGQPQKQSSLTKRCTATPTRIHTDKATLGMRTLVHARRQKPSSATKVI